MNRHYVYRHIRLDTDTPCYIGKGSYNRAYDLERRNNYHTHIIKNHGIDVEIVMDNLTEKEAFSKEIEFIKLYKDLGYCEANFTEGGEGYSAGILNPKWNGYCYTPKGRFATIIDASESYNMDYYRVLHRCHSNLYPEWFLSKKIINLKFDKYHKYIPYEKHYRVGKPHSEITKAKISKATKGRIPWNKGISHSEETINKISLSLKSKTPWNKGRHDIICTSDACFFDIELAMSFYNLAKSTIHCRCRNSNFTNWYKIKRG